jgi:hypothetical protein
VTTRKINGNTYSEFAVVAAEPIPVDIQGATLSLDADGVEIKNDVGHPIPVSDAGGSLTVDSTALDSIDADTAALVADLAAVEVLLTSVDADTSAIAVDAAAIESLLATIDVDTGSIDDKLPALSSGRIPVDIGAISLGDVEIKNDSGNPIPISAASLPIPTGAATEAKQDTGNTSLGNIDADLGAPADAAASSDTGTFGLIALIKRGLQNWTTLLGRVPANLTVTSTRLLVDGSGVTQPTSVALRTPTTASITSSASSVTILAANADRRGLSIANDSTSVLRLSFATPATSANAFIVMQPGSFLWLDQQLMITGAIYGIWASANGTAQVTEYV